MSTNAKYGVFAAIVNLISVLPFGERPVIFTRLKVKDGTAEYTHAIRLNNASSMRIGLTELRGAFPKELGPLNDEQVIIELMTKTKLFVDRELEISIEPQINKEGKVAKDPKTGAEYFNVRLRSNVHDIDPDTATKLVQGMMNGFTTKEAVDKEFAA